MEYCKRGAVVRVRTHGRARRRARIGCWWPTRAAKIDVGARARPKAHEARAGENALANIQLTTAAACSSHTCVQCIVHSKL